MITIPHLTQIAAIGRNGELGCNGGMCWHDSEDLQFFKNNTMGKPMIMGRTTFESLPGVLPDRLHFVLTRDPNAMIETDQVIPVYSDWEAYKRITELGYEEATIIGGASVYKLTAYVSRILLLTVMNDSYPEADTFFPGFRGFKHDMPDIDGWKCACRLTTEKPDRFMLTR